MGPFAKMLHEIRAQQSSKLEKGFILERYCREKWIRQAVKMAYDPFYQFWVKKDILDIPAATVEHPSELGMMMWDNYALPLLLKMNQRAYTKADLMIQLKHLIGALKEHDAEALKCIILKDLRMGMAARGINNALAVMLGEDLIPVPDTQLCMTWNPSLQDPRQNLWATPKINGLRGRWKARDGGFRFLTREDYPLIGFDAIEGELGALCAKYHLGMVDGEVFSVEHPFQTIMSIARGTKKVSQQLKDELMYYVFNIHSEDGPFSSTDLMVTMLRGIDWSEYPHLQPVPYTLIKNTPGSVIEQCREYASQGWEGIVMRDPNVCWEAGKRNRNLMKFKLFYETDLTVTGLTYGTVGKKWEGQLVALKCEGGIRSKWFKCNNGDSFRVPLGPGEEGAPDEEMLPIRVDASLSTLTDAERKLISEMIESGIVGKTAEVRFQAITDHPDEEGFWSLQFPTFLKFKD